MRLVCPTCQAVYEVPEAALLASPRVQCVKCSHEWAPPLPPPVPGSRMQGGGASRIDDSDLLTESPHRDRLYAEFDPPAGKGPAIAWAATAIVLIALVVAAYIWRADVMHAWPASMRLYAAIGLGAPSM